MTLSVTRAKDREKMAQAVEALCADYGATCERTAWHGEREIGLRITLGAATVGLGLDGDDAQDRKGVFCLPWNIHHEVRDKCFSGTFMIDAGTGGSYPFRASRKCMTFSDSFDGCGPRTLLMILRDCFECIKEGRAFIDVEPHTVIKWEDSK